MTDQIKESLSVLMDGEASELDLARVLKNSADSELRSSWARYHLVRQVMSEGSARAPQLDLSSRVMAALEIEPEIKPVARWHDFLRPVASVAVAASVFASVLVGSQLYGLVGGVEAGSPGELAAQVSTVGMVNTLGGSAVRAGYATPAVRTDTAPRYADYDQMAKQRLQRYMLSHSEEAALNAPRGMMPYARVASFEAQD
jgi:sigma-E factor negative regulatory protein RseA